MALRRSLRPELTIVGRSGHAVYPPVVATDPRSCVPARRCWWARQVLNLRPLACEASALPLSYAPWRSRLRVAKLDLRSESSPRAFRRPS